MAVVEIRSGDKSMAGGGANEAPRAVRRSSARVRNMAIAYAEDLARKAAALEAMRPPLLKLAERCEGDDCPDRPIIGPCADGGGE